MSMRVSIPSSVVGQYERFSRYNSPYPAHDAGCAVDLYPAGEMAVSPVAGGITLTRGRELQVWTRQSPVGRPLRVATTLLYCSAIPFFTALLYRSLLLYYTVLYRSAIPFFTALLYRSLTLFFKLHSTVAS